jgi:DNA-binding LacI/PurR family transcriptional regulator
VSSAAAQQISIPDRLGVIGGDNTPVAALARPSISSVEFDLPSEAKRIAVWIADALGLERASAAGDDGAEVVRVIARESTALSGH